MAITTEIIGRFGGGVDIYPVNVPINRGNTLLHTVTVPEGKRVLVSVSGVSPTMPGTSYAPTLSVGEVSSTPAVRYGEYGVAAVVEEDTEVRFKPRSSSGINNADFEGTVYITEIH